MARILGTYHYPQVSYFSSINVLSNKDEFPSFFRTIPSDTFQTTALAAIVEHFGWKWVGTLAEDNDYGHVGVQLFTEQVVRLGACIAFSETIPLTYSRTKYLQIAETIKQSSANVIIVFSGDTNLLPLVWEIAKQNITGKTWLASEGWSTSAFVIEKEHTRFFSGTLGLAIPIGKIPGLKNFLLQLNTQQKPLVKALKAVNFTDPDGNHHYFDKNGDPVAKYDIVNWQMGENGLLSYKKVGSYYGSTILDYQLVIDEQTTLWNGGQSQVWTVNGITEAESQQRKTLWTFCDKCFINYSTDCIKCPPDYWSNRNRDACIPKEVDYLSFGEPLGITFSVAAGFGICQTLLVIGVFIKYRNTPIVRANNLEVSFLLLMSLTLSFIVKTLVVTLAFTMSRPNQSVMKYFRPSHQRVLVGFTTIIQILICVGFLSSTSSFTKKNRETVLTKIILECNRESELVFLVSFGYIGLLAVLCFILAFLARKLPDSFNEAKFITFSLLVFVMVWVSFIPAYVSTSGKYVTAVEIFAILSSAAGLLACIFYPKCYIILVKPEENSKKKLTGRPYHKK
ncbi:extracellular calcium-sensing receptor-like [Leptodactylus fuscus]